MSSHGVGSIEQVIDIITGYWRTATIRTALDLRAADHIQAGRDTAGAIADAEGADPRGVRAVLDACCALGLMDRRDGRYALEAISSGVMTESAVSFRTAAPIWLNDLMWDAWWRLPEVVRSGKPIQMPVDHPFWELFARSSFGVAQISGAAAASFLGVTPGAGLRVLDVGCGSGGVGFAFAVADPTATVTGLDGPTVLGIARENAERLGIAGRVTHRAVDLATEDDYGEGAFDLAIVSHVLHAFDADGARAILRRLARALSPGGRLLVAEMVPDDERRRTAFALLFGVLVYMLQGADVFTEAELRSWISEVGLTEIQRHPALGYATYLVATRS